MAKRARELREAALTLRTDIRVRFSEVDSMRIVWHGEYVRYFEDGREAFGRHYGGLGYGDFVDAGYTAPIVELHVDFKRPLKMDDTAEVETRYVACDAAKICFDYVVRRKATGEIAATGRTVQVLLDGNGDMELCCPKFYEEWKRRWLK